MLNSIIEYFTTNYDVLHLLLFLAVICLSERCFSLSTTYNKLYRAYRSLCQRDELNAELLKVLTKTLHENGITTFKISADLVARMEANMGKSFEDIEKDLKSQKGEQR